MKKRGFIILAVIALSAVAVLCLYPRNNKSTDTNKDNKLDRDEFRNFMVAETQFEVQDRLNTMSKIMNTPDPEAEMEKSMERTISTARIINI